MDVLIIRPLRAIAASVLAAFTVAGCTTVSERATERPAAVETIQILGLNDFHGYIEALPFPATWYDGGTRYQEPLGGAARLGGVLSDLRQGQAHTITVAAGDLIGASPLASSYFLDEPTIMALNRLGLELAAVGNHEFDRGIAELQRMQDGGCETHTTREPCQIDRPFEGARFTYLAANVLDESRGTLFPATAVREFGGVRVGFIGLTLKETGVLVSPSATEGYTFADEADTANALAARVRAEGADTVVLLIHQGGVPNPINNLAECPQLSGDILPILERLDPAIRLVISGHTHAAYVCGVPAADGSTRLLTSAGRYGSFVTDIRLSVDPANDAVIGLSAVNRPVTQASAEQADIAALVRRYVDASAPIAARVVGRIDGSLAWEGDRDTDWPLANLIADAQLAATRDIAAGGAEIALMNSGGVRTRLEPAADGGVTFGQIFALQPFGNGLVVLEMTGAELKQALEEQFGEAVPAQIANSSLIPSAGFAFAFDRSKPFGDRISALTLHGQAIDPARTYRVAVNSFLASGGDGFATFAAMPKVGDGGPDLDALEVYLAGGVAAPAAGRVRDVTPSR